MKDMLMAKKADLQKRDKKGFTLMELLIVVAIIAVLVAVAIPMFTNQLEKSREATDEANIRSLYAETTAAVLNEDTTAKTSINGATLTVTNTGGVTKGVGTYTLTQQKAGLEGGATSVNIGGVSIGSADFGPNKTATITVTSDGTLPTIKIA